MEDGIVAEEEPMSEGDEDQVMEVEIKQEVLIGDEYVEEEVGNSRTDKDEDAGCPMIKQEDSSAADPLCEESDVLQGSIGVQRTEAGPAPTLRFLATGRSYEDLKFSTGISAPSLSQIIPETCKALYEVLKKDNVKVSCEVMEDGIVVKEEPMSEGDEDQVMEVEIKQEELIWDEYVEEDVGNSRTVKDEDGGCPMIKQEDSSAADPLCDESDVLQGSIGEQRSEAGPAQVSCEVMEDGITVKEEPMSEGDEDQVMGELVLIKQEVLIGDDYVEEEVGNSTTVKDEDAGCPMVKQEDSSDADPLYDESDKEVSCEVMEDGIVVKEEPMSEGDEDQEMGELVLIEECVKEEVGNSWTVEGENAGCPMIKQEDSSAADPLCDESDVLQGSIGVQRSEAGPAQVSCEVMEDGIVVKEEPMSEGDEDQVIGELVLIKQEVLIGDEYVKEEVGNSRTVEGETAGCPMIKQEDSSAALCDESDVLQGSIGVQSESVESDPFCNLCGVAQVQDVLQFFLDCAFTADVLMEEEMEKTYDHYNEEAVME
ncbi:hypothetical protein GE061_008732 [Apolygus lucorum]|uniref:Uncharacterized protein n=1 Tax=Apolygus lucorum TaxID=248454 RepID=A0A8S9WPM8_APOLU|nr:hypothetical protein GE061_008732 [Apolygus lucorum]